VYGILSYTVVETNGNGKRNKKNKIDIQLKPTWNTMSITTNPKIFYVLRSVLLNIGHKLRYKYRHPHVKLKFDLDSALRSWRGKSTEYIFIKQSKQNVCSNFSES